MEGQGPANPPAGGGGEKLKLITCVVQRGRADKLAKAAIEAGAGGATVFFARGMGVRERLGLLGLAIVPEKEVLMIICHDREVRPILTALTRAGDLDVPGHGIAFVTPIEAVVGFIPGSTLDDQLGEK